MRCYLTIALPLLVIAEATLKALFEDVWNGFEERRNIVYEEEDVLDLSERAILPQALGPQKPCVDPLQRRGVCMKLANCPEIAKRASSVFEDDNLQFLQKSLCGYFGANSVGYYCCATASPALPSFTPPGKFDPTPTPVPRSPEELEYKNENLLDKKDGKLAVSATSPTLNSRWCGHSNFTTTRIVGGRESFVGAWPWAVLLKDGASGLFFCGGALITNHHVLTAAHCVNAITTKTLQIRLREHDISKTSDGETFDIQVHDIVLHPEYEENQYSNDIAILVLKEAVFFTDRIRPICVPKERLWRNRNVTGLTATVIGWGRQDYSDLHSSDVLREAEITVKHQDQCLKAYSSFKNVKITDNVFCAGGKADSCQGDSGGALMIPSKGRYQLIGIVSAGFRCGDPNFPGIYTRVQKYFRWIQQVVDYQDDESTDNKKA